jgi:hypothetical protein
MLQGSLVETPTPTIIKKGDGRYSTELDATKRSPVRIASGTDSRSDAAAGSAKGVLKSGTSEVVIAQNESGSLETTSAKVDVTKVGPAKDERTLRISKDISDFSQNLRAKRLMEAFKRLSNDFKQRSQRIIFSLHSKYCSKTLNSSVT